MVLGHFLPELVASSVVSDSQDLCIKFTAGPACLPIGTVGPVSFLGGWSGK
jgi:hypothetical protein